MKGVLLHDLSYWVLSRFDVVLWIDMLLLDLIPSVDFSWELVREKSAIT
jgi:hypothetical protein